jgi:phage baseplate assembly protein W
MPRPVKNRTYVGYSSTSGDGLHVEYDAQLINADLNNVFNTRKGECLTDPSFGSIVWSMLFEPSNQANLNLVQQDCMNILNAETRVKVQSLSVTASTDPTNPGFVLQATLLYIGLNVSANFGFNFLQNLSTNDNGE